MIPSLRAEFNSRFTAEGYKRLLASVDRRCGTHVSFRVAETPTFFPKALLDEMADTGAELTHRLVGNQSYLAASSRAIPEAYRVPGETPHPHFMTADFGLVRQPDGSLTPKLVELQAFPSVFAYQVELTKAYSEIFSLDPALGAFLGGHNEDSFWKLFAQVVLNGHNPENVVLTEIEPEQQKTIPDFLVTARRLGIQIVDISSLMPKGNKLYYRHLDGRVLPVHRIYNRAIVDELIRKEIKLPFDYRVAFDVEWAGHPNWYFLISKFSIPYLDHPSVPRGVFLNDWYAGPGRALLKPDSAPAQPGAASRYGNLLLKPLFSFAGKGILFDPTDDDLAAIPVADRGEYLLQQRVHFESVIDTPHGLTQPEIRILYLWPDGGKLEPVLPLVRLGRGKMMGVDHNRDLEWVGASSALFPP